MSLKSIKLRFRPGTRVRVTNHYITRPDHPCFGTRERVIARSTSSHFHFEVGGAVEWPKAAQVQMQGDRVVLFGGGAGQKPTDLFLTIEFL